jgi:hypothetical protein
MLTQIDRIIALMGIIETAIKHSTELNLLVTRNLLEMARLDLQTIAIERADGPEATTPRAESAA